MEALLARRKQFEGPKPALEEYGGAAGPKKAIRGTEACTRRIWRRCWPEESDSRDRSLHSKNMEALLARKKQFEGPKPALKEYGGAAGPKKAIRGTTTLTLEYNMRTMLSID
jgi:hypothetical protein